MTLQLVAPSIEDMEFEEKLRKRAFAANYALGTPLVKSMRIAGFEMPTKQSAARLLQDPFVQEEMEKAFEQLRSSLMQSKELIIAQLDDAVETAHNLQEMPSVIAGIVAKAKILGLMDKDNRANMPEKVKLEWGDDSTETIYEKSNPLLYNAMEQTLGEKEHGKG